MKTLHTAHQNELGCKDKKHHSNIHRLVIIVQHSVPGIAASVFTKCAFIQRACTFFSMN